MPQYNVIMTKAGNPTIGYLRTWESSVTGTKYSFSASRDEALAFDGKEAVEIVAAFRNEKKDATISYSTRIVGDS